ncbi:MAG: hypothetical protein KJ954_14185 [Alphaproteobacteria bacterium]|nr:hypothetical protein [Alphaproteobacteria bacterium]
MIDSNQIVRAYLASGAGLSAPLVALVGARIYSPRLPENATLPAVGFFTRGGTSTPYIPDIITPSKQFDCWASSPIDARAIYRVLYDALQGIQHVKVTIGGTDYYIESAREEVQGQDLQDEIQGYFRVLTFFEIMVK